MSTNSEELKASTLGTAHLDKFDSLRSVFFRHVAQDDTAAVDTTVRQHLDLAARRTAASDLVAYLPADREARTGPALLVITDDRPLLVDALTAGVESAGATIAHLLHPVISVVRGPDGALIDLSVGASPPAETIVESWIRIEFATPPSDSIREYMMESVWHLLLTLRQINADSPVMRAQQRDLADTLEKASAAGESSWSEDELVDAAALLRWLGDGNFTLLGYYYRGDDTREDRCPSALGTYRGDAGDLRTQRRRWQAGPCY